MSKKLPVYTMEGKRYIKLGDMPKGDLLTCLSRSLKAEAKLSREAKETSAVKKQGKELLYPNTALPQSRAKHFAKDDPRHPLYSYNKEQEKLEAKKYGLKSLKTNPALPKEIKVVIDHKNLPTATKIVKEKEKEYKGKVEPPSPKKEAKRRPPTPLPLPPPDIVIPGSDEGSFDPRIFRSPVFHPDDEEIKHHQRGSGHSFQGLYSGQIEQGLEPIKSFVGTYAIDQISNVKLHRHGPTSFVFNTDVSTGPGKHWIAVWIDPYKSKTVEIYDSLGNDKDPSYSLPHTLIPDIRRLVDKLHLPYRLKVKTNGVPDQRSTSKTCGLFAMNFILDKAADKSFAEASHFDSKNQAEKEVREIGKEFKFL